MQTDRPSRRRGRSTSATAPDRRIRTTAHEFACAPMKHAIQRHQTRAHPAGGRASQHDIKRSLRRRSLLVGLRRRSIRQAGSGPRRPRVGPHRAFHGCAIALREDRGHDLHSAVVDDAEVSWRIAFAECVALTQLPIYLDAQYRAPSFVNAHDPASAPGQIQREPFPNAAWRAGCTRSRLNRDENSPHADSSKNEYPSTSVTRTS